MSRNETESAKRAAPWNWLLAAVIVLALAAAIVAARPGSGPASPSPALAAAPPAVSIPIAAASAAGGLKAREGAFDFGAISMAAGKVTHRFWFRNEGDAPVLIRKIYTSCMCTAATLVKGMKVINTYGMPGHGPLPAVNESLQPGEAAYIDAVFDPAAHGPAGLGPTQRVITVEGDPGQRLELRFAANVRP